MFSDRHFVDRKCVTKVIYFVNLAVYFIDLFVSDTAYNGEVARQNSVAITARAITARQ